MYYKTIDLRAPGKDSEPGKGGSALASNLHKMLHYSWKKKGNYEKNFPESQEEKGNVEKNFTEREGQLQEELSGEPREERQPREERPHSQADSGRASDYNVGVGFETQSWSSNPTWSSNHISGLLI